jgi:D-arabinose 1-dehydrogenase-like Zn-dependent alcohol dehydrogenase
MKAIVVTDQAAGTAGMTLAERPEPSAALNDVIVQIHASGFVLTELAWPSTWTDRRNRDRTPSIPGHELAGVVTALGRRRRELRHPSSPPIPSSAAATWTSAWVSTPPVMQGSLP